jgi:hypothetical protein
LSRKNDLRRLIDLRQEVNRSKGSGMFEVRVVTGRDANGTTYDEKNSGKFESADVAIENALAVPGTKDIFRENVARPASRIARVHPDGGIDYQ